MLLMLANLPPRSLSILKNFKKKWDGGAVVLTSPVRLINMLLHLINLFKMLLSNMPYMWCSIGTCFHIGS